MLLPDIKFDFGWGSAPDPAGELTALPQTLYLDLRGLFLRRGRRGIEGKGRERKMREGESGGKGEGRRGEEGEGM